MNKLKVAVVGVGHLGKFHAEKYKKLTQTELLAVCDVNATACTEVAQNLGVESLADYRQLAGRVDAVSIATPTNSHHEIALFFLRQGIHVLLEKPITLNLSEADDLLAEAKRHCCILQIGHIERFNPTFIEALPKIHAPKFISASRLAPFKPRGLDISVILDLMIHEIDLIHAVVKSDIASIAAKGMKISSSHWDVVNARIEFNNGCVASVTASRVSSIAERKWHVFQDDGEILIDFSAPKNSDALYAEISAFADCVLHQKQPLVDGVAAREALATALEITRIVESNAYVK